MTTTGKTPGKLRTARRALAEGPQCKGYPFDRRIAVDVRSLVGPKNPVSAVLRLPVGAAPVWRGVEDRPERIEVGRAAWILLGVGHRGAHLAGPEMPDRAVALREHAVAGHIGIVGANVVARVIAGDVREDFVSCPATRSLCLDQPRDRRLGAPCAR